MRQIQTLAEENTDDTDSDFEENVEREMLVHYIIAEINLSHPVHDDVYDLCDMCEQKRLSVCRLAMLKEICTYFELELAPEGANHSNCTYGIDKHLNTTYKIISLTRVEYR